MCVRARTRECVCLCVYVHVHTEFIFLTVCTGLKLQCSKNMLDLTATILTEFPLTTLEWVR